MAMANRVAVPNRKKLGIETFNQDNTFYPSMECTSGKSVICRCILTLAFVQLASMAEGILYHTETDGYLTITGIEGTNEVVIPETIDGLTVKAIGANLFPFSASLKKLIIPKTITDIAPTAFLRAYGMEAFQVDSANPSYTAIDGVIFDKSGSTLVRYPSGRSGSYVIPDGVNTIQEIAFYRADSLTGITVPSGVTSIGERAFEACFALSSITLPDSLTSIGGRAFDSCIGLVEVNLPPSLKELPEALFYNCSSLRELTFPEGPESIRVGAFISCAITELTIPSSIKQIEDQAFASCQDLVKVVLPASLERIGARTFWDCPKLKRVYFQGDEPEITSVHGLPEPQVFSDVYQTVVIYPSDREGWNDTFGGSPTAMLEDSSVWGSVIVHQDERWETDWYGEFLYSDNPWIYHEEHGYQLPAGSSATGLWLYDVNLRAWLWTLPDFYPLIYIFGEPGDWHWYLQGGKLGERWFYDFRSQEWFRENPPEIGYPPSPRL
jgi:hypothetical protein